MKKIFFMIAICIQHGITHASQSEDVNLVHSQNFAKIASDLEYVLRSHSTTMAPGQLYLERYEKSRDEGSNNLLHVAVKQGCLQLVRYIIFENIFPINARNANGETPLNVAVLQTQDSSVDVVRALLHARADMEIPDREGFTPLLTASLHNKPIFLELLKNGANPNIYVRRGEKSREHFTFTIGRHITMKRPLTLAIYGYYKAKYNIQEGFREKESRATSLEDEKQN